MNELTTNAQNNKSKPDVADLKTVLVVDPDEAFQAYLLDSLHGLKGVRIIRVSNADDAISYLQFRPAVNLIVFDWYELIAKQTERLLAHLKNNKKFSKTVTVLATSEFYIEEIHARLGTESFITKNLPQDLINHHFEGLLGLKVQVEEEAVTDLVVEKLRQRMNQLRKKINMSPVTNGEFDFMLDLMRTSTTRTKSSEQLLMILDFLTLGG